MSSSAATSGPKPASSGASISLAIRFALRELRGGLRGFYIFLACIALGVGAISGVNSVAQSITSGIAAEGKGILGGDIAFSLNQRQFSSEELSFIKDFGAVSKVGKLRAMARLPDGSDQVLVEVKAVDEAYPLQGELVSNPPIAAASLAKNDNQAIVDPLLLDRLQIKIGDKIKLGSREITIHGTLTNEPDRVGDGVGFGPKILISHAALLQSGLVQPGSLIKWSYRLELDDPSDRNLNQIIEDALKKFPDAGWRIRSRSNAAPSLSRNIERFSQFLTLVGLTALIVGGVGVANAIRAYLEGKRQVIASFKSLGAPAEFVFLVYLLQIMFLATIGIAIGLLIGAAMPFIAKIALAGIIPVGSSASFYPGALALGAVYGFLASLAFAIWPLAQARDIPATALFRENERTNRIWPRPIYIVLMVLLIVTLASLAIFFAEQRMIAMVFVGAILFAFIMLRLVAMLIQWLAKRAPRVKSTGLRMALGNIHRPGSLTQSVVLSLGLGLALLVALALIDGNLRQQISGNIPKQAPDFFFVDIQNTQLAEFSQFMKTNVPEANIQTVPMLRGRIITLNNTPAEKADVMESGRWVLRGDRGLTYSSKLPANSSISDGSWWDEDYSGEPLVSFSAEEAGELYLKVGDHITVNVLGRNITARIANLRNVEWQSLAINFVMVFSPNTFAGAPHAHLATLQLNDTDATKTQTVKRDAEILRIVTNKFPTVTTVRVRDALNTINELIGQLATAIRAAAALALVASILVLGGALAAGNTARVHDSIVLKTLGATRKMLISAFTLEYLILGLATAIFAILTGSIASWFVISNIMGFTSVFLPEVAIGTVIIALVLTVGFGLIGTWRVLGQKAAPVLRNL
jgi:putative ABC transport system permease protein